MMVIPRQYRHRTTFLLVIASVILSGGSVLGCPEETVDHGTLHVQTFQGRVLPYAGEELLPTELEFIITTPESNEREERRVPVQPNGEFMLALAPGTYRFRIKAQGFLFTLVGTVVVGQSKDAHERLTIQPPWC
jgi:hypothetical protein